MHVPKNTMIKEDLNDYDSNSNDTLWTGYNLPAYENILY